MNHHVISRRAGAVRLALLASLALVLVGAALLMWRRPAAAPDPAEGRRVSEVFLELIRAGSAGPAWDSTTAEFKSAQGREKFLRYVKEHKVLSQPLTFVSIQEVKVQNRPHAECVFRSPDGRATVRLLVGNDQGALRVDRLLLD